MLLAVKLTLKGVLREGPILNQKVNDPIQQHSLQSPLIPFNDADVDHREGFFISRNQLGQQVRGHHHTASNRNAPTLRVLNVIQVVGKVFLYGLNLFGCADILFSNFGETNGVCAAVKNGRAQPVFQPPDAVA